MADSVQLLPPWTRESIAAGLRSLKMFALLGGYRGKPAADVDALIAAVLSIANYATTNVESLIELDVNPVIVRPIGKGAIAVDALIRLQEPVSHEE
jgi:hypothetical protein